MTWLKRRRQFASEKSTSGMPKLSWPTNTLLWTQECLKVSKSTSTGACERMQFKRLVSVLHLTESNLWLKGKSSLKRWRLTRLSQCLLSVRSLDRMRRLIKPKKVCFPILAKLRLQRTVSPQVSLIDTRSLATLSARELQAKNYLFSLYNLTRDVSLNGAVSRPYHLDEH